MLKKSFFFFFIAVAIGAVFYFFLGYDRGGNYFCRECPFCDPSIIQRQAFYEDDLVLALCTHKPVMPGHCLIIPKRHVERFELTSDEEASQICRAIKKVDRAVSKAFDTSAYLLLQKNGREVGQAVPHIHVHYIPRKAGDCSIFKFIFKMFFVELKDPISSAEMDETVEKFRRSMK